MYERKSKSFVKTMNNFNFLISKKILSFEDVNVTVFRVRILLEKKNVLKATNLLLQNTHYKMDKCVL